MLQLVGRVRAAPGRRRRLLGRRGSNGCRAWPARYGGGQHGAQAYSAAVAVTPRLASRLRATRAAAAAPNNRTIGGAGTGVGVPLLPVDVPLDVLVLDVLPVEVMPLLVLQPLLLDP